MTDGKERVRHSSAIKAAMACRPERRIGSSAATARRARPQARRSGARQREQLHHGRLFNGTFSHVEGESVGAWRIVRGHALCVSNG